MKIQHKIRKEVRDRDRDQKSETEEFLDFYGFEKQEQVACGSNLIDGTDCGIVRPIRE